MPKDFHHVFSPVDGVCTDVRFINGRYRMDPTNRPCENVRVCISIKSAHIGKIDMTLVGALGVASVRAFISAGDRLYQGQHIGHFDVGGSAILLGFDNWEQNIVTGFHFARASICPDS
jgi:phosphatidylserine decarboxylase